MKNDLQKDIGLMLYSVLAMYAPGELVKRPPNGNIEIDDWQFKFFNDPQFHSIVARCHQNFESKYEDRRTPGMKEQLCIYCSHCRKEPVWYAGSRYLIPENKNRAEVVSSYCECDSVSLIHTHPLGNPNPSQTDKDTLKGWRFFSGKDINMILVSGMSIQTVRAKKKEDGKIKIFKLGTTSVYDYEEMLVLEAIERSNYV